MRVSAPLLLCLLSALVEVHSQTAPYLTFRGNNIPNNSYVDLNTVGSNSSNDDAVVCHTDLTTCCRSVQGPDRGDWYFPFGGRLHFISADYTYEVRGAQVVALRYIGIHRPFYHSGPFGIYRCDIETNAVNNNDGNETLFVGLYISGGE